MNPFASLEILSFEWDTCEGDDKVLNLPSLHKLSIKTCPQLLGRLPTHLSSLQKLEIHRCTSLVVSISGFLSPCELSISGCAELVDDCSSPAKEVSSLQTLSLSNISKFNIPADRTMLRFGKSEHFEIDGWEELASLSQHGVGIHSLKLMFSEGFQDLASLKELVIHDCPKLTSLPEKDMLRSLGHLCIISCPSLKEECSSDKGREWSKISHIPLVEIDCKTVISRESD
ncbi:hypothetical protein Golax_020675 [Gossypium laxum]|uniref:Uncharacterized protein n=1 Tax=Gossypium laxum TaxID=34288 RepID=A0A7J9AZL8_9ROSI|nr:hypothetical protein [Gossypium laxum]